MANFYDDDKLIDNESLDEKDETVEINESLSEPQEESLLTFDQSAQETAEDTDNASEQSSSEENKKSEDTDTETALDSEKPKKEKKGLNISKKTKIIVSVTVVATVLVLLLGVMLPILLYHAPRIFVKTAEDFVAGDKVGEVGKYFYSLDKDISCDTLTLENGNVYTANLRRAKCTDEFILSGEEDVFEPEFTYHGFKYAELRKTQETEILSIEGAVLSQNINYYGKFECSDEVINGVWRMALRGQKSNFISIPTDCPQRDERLGWTGDAEVFCNSAMFNADCNLFFKNYLKLVREDALPDGKIPSIVPFYMPLADNTAGVPGWGDCITVIPYFHYLHYRDKSVIVDNFPVAEKWIAYYLAKSKNYLTKITNNFGDWLSVHGDSDPDGINQCFFGYSVALTAKMCEILGLHDKSIAYRELFEKCKTAFRENFYHDGRIRSDTQTMYAFAYIAGYLSKEETAARLPEKIRENGGGLTTGFIGSRFLLPALCDIGETKLAYSLIMRTEYPSWGYMLKNGATTVWERWNGYTRENGFEDPEMNSFNHYSLGSCVEWLYSYVLGIKLSPETEKVIINPSFCELLSFAKGETQLKSGKISVYWKYENASVCLEVKADDGIEYEIDYTSKKIISMIRTGNDTIAVFRAQ